MPIKTEPRYFGEGIYESTGAKTPEEALASHRTHVRVQRLTDLLGKDANLSIVSIITKIDSINSAIKAADNQVEADNAAFIAKHKLGA